MHHSGFLKFLLPVVAFLLATPAFADGGHPAVFKEMREPSAEELSEGAPLAVIMKQIKAVQKDMETYKGKAPAIPPTEKEYNKAVEKREDLKKTEPSREEKEMLKATHAAAADKASTDAILATMTPALQKSIVPPTIMEISPEGFAVYNGAHKDAKPAGFQVPSIRKTSYYLGLAKVNTAKPMRFNVAVSDPNHLMINAVFDSIGAGRLEKVIYLKKFDQGWLQCHPDEFPSDTLADLGIKRKKARLKKIGEK